MPKLPTKAQHGMQPMLTAESGAAAGSSQLADINEPGQMQQPIEPDLAKIVDAHRTERHVEDLGGEID